MAAGALAASMLRFELLGRAPAIAEAEPLAAAAGPWRVVAIHDSISPEVAWVTRYVELEHVDGGRLCLSGPVDGSVCNYWEYIIDDAGMPVVPGADMVWEVAGALGALER